MSTGRDLARNAFPRYLVALATSGELVPWADFLGAAAHALPRATPREGLVERWRRIRRAVLDNLDAFDLDAIVIRTDVTVELADHFADAAGLVHVHRRERGYAWQPEIPAWALRGRSRHARWAQAMFARHGLLPADERVPHTLHAFAGQVVDDAAPAFGWLDHARAWLDGLGRPVLSVEPYAIGAAELADTIRRDLDQLELPLLVDGPHAGVWSTSALLALVRYDPAGDVAPAIADAVQAPALAVAR